MFQQNANKWFFVCVKNSRNIIPPFHKKVISNDPPQNIYPNLTRTGKNKFYENKIKLNRLNPLKKKFWRYNWCGLGETQARPLPDRVNKHITQKSLNQMEFSRNI